MSFERVEKPEGIWFLAAGHVVHAVLLLLPSLLLAEIWELPFDVLLLALVIVASAFLESRWTPVEGGGGLSAAVGERPQPGTLTEADEVCQGRSARWEFSHLRGQPPQSAGLRWRTAALMTRTRRKIPTSDPLAIRIAWMVGATLLGLLWAAQIERPLRIASIDPAWQLLGGLALLAGCGLRLSAIATLGPAFVSDICCRGPRVRRGVYAWVKHPSELGLVLLGSGGPLLVAAPLTTIAALMLLVPTALWRIRREELAWQRIPTSAGKCWPRELSDSTLDPRHLPSPQKSQWQEPLPAPGADQSISRISAILIVPSPDAGAMRSPVKRLSNAKSAR